MLLRYFWNSRGDAFEILGLFFPQEENLRRSVWNSWEIKEIFILDGYTHTLLLHTLFIFHKYLDYQFLNLAVYCVNYCRHLITSFDMYSFTASKSLHLLFCSSSEGGWHSSWYWSWIWSSVLLLVWAWPNNPAGCSPREYKHDITLGYHEMMNTGIKDKDIKRNSLRFLNGSYCPDFHCTINVSHNAQKTS